MMSADLVGYVASTLVFATFYMKTMMPLRVVAIASNVAFMAYGYIGGMTPILVLHAALLPLNVWRLRQTGRLISKVRRAAEGDLSFEGLIPYASHRRFAAGETIFRKGDLAQELFVIASGRVWVAELKVEVGNGSIIGEIGVFSPCKARTATALAITPVEVLAISEDRVIALCHDNREFSFYLLMLITKRMIANFEELERQVARRGALSV
jgi:CRP/FNR family cyclic AMP-dependent transcriptional regulator